MTAGMVYLWLQIKQRAEVLEAPTARLTRLSWMRGATG